ncbi:glycosyltransferase family 4 protein [Bacillus solimangrovi]|uniref:Glycosyl transferase n=1 Tax=Bacillus solimangrovi TaxID=1305675 RepID=A0A1E5LF73_9BACI|nr:glycosyltransferase family 1 protein [Bacillus solimangrovi]OEH92731.1 glycosyl transferase [Bacillus solimangrovi]
MKVAIITETFLPSTDGIVTRLCESIKWLRKEGHEVLIIAPDLGVNEFEGAQVEGVSPRSFFLYKDKPFAYPSRKVKVKLDQFAPDIVHVVNPAFLGLSGIYYARKRKDPLIASYHTNVPKYADYYKVPFVKPLLWWYFRMLHNKADLNLCTSKTVKDELNEKKFKNVHLWTRGVAVERFGPEKHSVNMRKYLTNQQQNKRLLLYVGRLAAEKEIEKIRCVLDEHEQYALAIVGDGPHRAALEEHFKGTNTTFTGFMHGEELASVYASSDVFVFPSTTETLGLVILEAMASGLPIVAAKSGPTVEQIKDGETGLLYDPNVENSLVETMIKLEDVKLRTRLAENAYQIGQSYGWAEPSRQLLSIYQKILA